LSATASSRLAVVVLAAGRGKRFPGVLSKVLVELDGKPLVGHVLDAVAELRPWRTVVVVGHGKDEVRRRLGGRSLETVDQGEPHGTGHAVQVAGSALGRASCVVLVLNGDVPGVRAVTMRRLVETLEDGTAAAILTAEVEEPGAYGRIVRRADGRVEAIVEAADATAEILRLREINVGSYAFRAPDVFDVLAQVTDDNAQGEIYLTDVVARLVARGEAVAAVVLDDPVEGSGVNTPEDLDRLRSGGPAGG